MLAAMGPLANLVGMSFSATIDTEVEKGDADVVGEAAAYNFAERPYNCAEAVLAAHAEARGEDPSLIAGFGSAYGQGMGQGLTCGALAAALMVVGRVGQEQSIGRKEIRARAASLFRDFEAEFGHSECRVLSGHDCNDPSSPPFDSQQCGRFLRFAASRAHRAMAD